MKTSLAISALAIPLFLTGCETVIERPVPRRHVYVEPDVYQRPPPRTEVIERDVYVQPPPRRRTEVIVENRPYYGAPRVVYLKDHHGRYYLRGGRRVYVEVWRR